MRQLGTPTVVPLGKFAHAFPVPDYFAYGSNLSGRQVFRRCPDAAFLAIARLDGFALAFTRPSRRWGGHAADVLPQPHSHVWGVLWRISEADLLALDRFEGVASGAYVRATGSVVTANGASVAAEVYRVAAPADLGAPSPRYLHVILEGAREHGLPSDWLHHLASFAS